MGHGAIQAEETDTLLKIAVGDLMDGFFQERERFGAMTGFRKSHSALGAGLRLCGGGSLRGGLAARRGEEHQRRRNAKAKMKETIHGSIVHPTLAGQSSPEK